MHHPLLLTINTRYQQANTIRWLRASLFSPFYTAGRCMSKRQSSSSSKLPPLPTERQKTLNRFLGLPLEQRQTRVDSLFRKQEKLVSTSTLTVSRTIATTSVVRSTDSRHTMAEGKKVENGKHNEEMEEVAQSSDVEQVVEAPKGQLPSLSEHLGAS